MEKRRSGGWSTVAALVMGAILVARPAEAVVLNDPGTGFHIDARAAGTRECVIHPVALRDPAGCEGEDIPTAAPVASGGTQELGTVRFIEGDGRFAMTVLRAATPGQAEMSPDSAREFVEGFRRGVEQTPGLRVASGAPGSAVALLNVNGRQVLRHVVSLASTPSPGSPDRYVTYHVVGRDAVVTVIFFTWAADLPQVETRATAMMQTIAMDPPRARMEGSAAYQLGRACGALMCAGLGLLAVVLVLRGVSKKSNERAAQGGPWQPPPGGPQGPGGWPR